MTSEVPEEMPTEMPEDAVEYDEPTPDHIPDGTQPITFDDLPDEEGDAGLEDADLDPAIFEEN